MLLIYDEPGAYDGLTAEDHTAIYAEYGALNRDLAERGALVASHQFEGPGAARTVRVEDGRTTVGEGGVPAPNVTLGG